MCFQSSPRASRSIAATKTDVGVGRRYDGTRPLVEMSCHATRMTIGSSAPPTIVHQRLVLGRTEAGDSVVEAPALASFSWDNYLIDDGLAFLTNVSLRSESSAASIVAWSATSPDSTKI